MGEQGTCWRGLDGLHRNLGGCASIAADRVVGRGGAVLSACSDASSMASPSQTMGTARGSRTHCSVRPASLLARFQAKSRYRDTAVRNRVLVGSVRAAEGARRKELAGRGAESPARPRRARRWDGGLARDAPGAPAPSPSADPLPTLLPSGAGVRKVPSWRIRHAAPAVTPRLMGGFARGSPDQATRACACRPLQISRSPRAHLLT